MSHELESMFYTGDTPWHGQGTRLEAPPTAEKAIVAAGMDWTVEKRPMYTLAHKNETGVLDEMIAAEPFCAVVRDKDNAVLGSVSNGYQPLQNREAFAFFDPLVQSGQCEYHTAGALKGGQRVWVLAKLKTDPIEVVKNDPLEAYLLLSNGHDGQRGVRVMFTPIRVVCHNTLTAAEGTQSQFDAKGGIRIAHKGDVADTLESLRNTVDIAARKFQATAEQCRFLASRGVSGMDRYLREVFEVPVETKPDDLPRAIAEIESLYATGKGAQIAGVAGTCWGAYNAVTEWVDWQRGSNRARLDNAWFGVGATIKAKALEVATQMAKAA